VTVRGTLRRVSKTESVLYPQTLSYRQWETDFELTNESPARVELGGDLILIESNATGATYDGVAVYRELVGALARGGYGVSNVQGPFHGFNQFLLRWAKIYRLGGAEQTADVEYFTPTALDAGKSHRFRLTLRMGRWVPDGNVASVRIALPELRFATPSGDDRYRLVAHFQGAGEGPWTVARQELIPLRLAALAPLLEVPETDLVTRVLAANWLPGADRGGAREPLLRAARPLRDGNLLYACLVQLTGLKAVGLGDHARALLATADGPNGIRIQAARYLAAVRDRAALPTLVAAAGDKDDDVATAAIEALGALGGADADAALRTLLAGTTPEKRLEEIAKALLAIGRPESVRDLERRADGGNKAVMSALADAGSPETFAWFERLAAQPISPGWGGLVARGLSRAGKEKAITPLLRLAASTSEDTRREAASQLAGLDPGGRAREYLDAALDAADDRVTQTLLEQLSRTKWTDPRSARRLGVRLRASKDDFTALAIIDMLRAISGRTTGPADYSELVKDKARWVREWADWAATR
jgi:hypothetical protein